jgi:hypothetical protein
MRILKSKSNSLGFFTTADNDLSEDSFFVLTLVDKSLPNRRSAYTYTYNTMEMCVEIVVELLPVDYVDLRATEYPPIEDQLDALWKGGEALTEMQARIMAVKEKYPKEL